MFNIVLIRHFGDKLDANEADLVFGVFLAELILSHTESVGIRFTEVVVDIVNMVFVHHLLQEIVDIQFRATIDDSLNLV